MESQLFNESTSDNGKVWNERKNDWNTAIPSQILHDNDFCSSDEKKTSPNLK